MDNRTQTPTQESSASTDVVRTPDDADSTSLGDSPALPNDELRDNLPSGAEYGADVTNEPQRNGPLDVSSKSTAVSFAGHDSRHESGFDIQQGQILIGDGDNESISVFDHSGTDASSVAPHSTSDRENESELSEISNYDDGRDDESTSTVASESRKVDHKHGREYQAGHEYCWPNDEKHREQMDIFHHACSLPLEDRLYLAPIKENVQNVLDVGTGTGIWAMDFADEHPSARVIGTDISPIQPEWVPPNLVFQLHDANLAWTFRERFEFIHCRRMAGSITDWDKFAKHAFAALQPGGYFECHELSMSFGSDDNTHENCASIIEWEEFWKDVGTNSGRSFTVVEDGRLKKSMELAGFKDIQKRIYKMPVGSWPKKSQLKEVGQYTYAALHVDLEGFLVGPMVEKLGKKLHDAYVLAAQLRNDLRSGKVHAYLPFEVIFGRKP
ncbi:Asparaginase [Fusarium sp. LHS14.1]|nr:Asparaginase [Fusarium sp. LHS14.1]